MADALQDALARLDALVAKWRKIVAESEWTLDPERGDGAICAAAFVDTLDGAAGQLSAELAAIRAAHDLPASAASAAAPPADAPPCSAGLTAGASKDAPAISGVEQEKSGNAEARRQGD